MSFLSITPAEDAAVNALQFQGMLDLSENRVQTTKRFVHRDGHIVRVELNVVSIHPPEGGPRCFFVQAQERNVGVIVRSTVDCPAEKVMDPAITT